MAETTKRHRRRGRPIAVGVALCCAALTTTGWAAATPASAATCQPGTPVSYDFNGDGTADVAGADAVYGSTVSANLNGDTCADLVWQVGDSNSLVAWKLGTASGLPKESSEQSVPKASYTDLGEGEYLSLEGVTAMRNGDTAQVAAISQTWDEDGSTDGPVVLSLLVFDAAGQLTAVKDHRIENKVQPGGDGVTLAADNGVVAVGDWTHNAVQVYTFDTTGGLTQTKQITQNSPGISDSTESGDEFGASLAFRDGRLVIGAPGEKLGQANRAGLVQPLRWHKHSNSYTAYRAISQSTKGVPGSNETGDNFGSSLAIARGLTGTDSYDIIIGAPNEDVGSVKDAGTVTVANFTKARYRSYTQATSKVPGSVKKQHHWGAEVGAMGNSAAESMVVTTGLDGGACLPVMYTKPGRLTSTTGWVKLKYTCSAEE